MADPLLGTWWSTPPAPAVSSEFTTPGDLRRATMIAQTGFDPDHPWLGLARQLLTYMPMVAPGRSSFGARTINDYAPWAMQTPSAITGGGRLALDAMLDAAIRDAQPIPDSAILGGGRQFFGQSIRGLTRHNSRAFDNSMMDASYPWRPITPYEMGFYGPSAPFNTNIPGRPLLGVVPPSGRMPGW